MMGAHRAHGFTLVELLIIIAMVSILAAIAVPSMGELHRQNKLTSVINNYSAAHRLARNEAVARGKAVTVCKRSTADANIIACDADNNWESGWVVFVNTDRDNPAVVDADETVLQVIQPIPVNYTLRSSGVSGNHVTYHPTGDTQASGTFVLCSNGLLNQARMLAIDVNGRIRVSELSTNNVPLDDTGTEITTCIP